MTQIPLAPGLFKWPAPEPRLLGSRCGSCGAYTFPAQRSCPSCASDELEVIELGATGTVWTWTSQEYLPKAPPYAGPETAKTFVPFYVGYVELEGQLRVEARLVGFDDAPPFIGQAVRLAVVPFRTDPEGNEVMLYAFEPVEEASRG